MIRHVFLLFVIFGSGSAAIAQSVEFFGARVYNNPQSIHYGLESRDFDGDGNPDILTTTDNKILIYFGNGDGSFQMPPVTAFTALTQNFIFVQLPDVNNDSRADLVFISRNPTNSQKSVITIFGNADRTFSAPVYFQPADTLDYVYASDLDGDGIVDICGPSYYSNSNYLVIYKGSGNGQFTFAGQIATASSAGSVEFGDLDNDNLPDLVFSESRILKAAKNLGGGSFANPITLGQTTYGFISYKIGDLDNNGKKDIVATENASFSPDMYKWQNQGDFNFVRQPDQTITSRNWVVLRTISDINNNQTNDLIFSSSSRTIIYQGGGNGYFIEEGSFDEGSNNGMVVEDLDRDGWLDIASVQQIDFGNLGSGGFAVFRNLRNGFFRAATSLNTGRGSKFVNVADFNNDGLKDFVVAKQETGGGPGSIVIIVQLPVPVFETLKSDTGHLLGTGVNPFSVITGDFNRDNRMDVITVGHGAFGAPQNAARYINNVNSGFTEQLFQIGSGDIYDAATADLNNDGNLDLVTSSAVGISVSFGSSSGIFAPPVPYLSQISSGQITLADFNNDLKTDIAVTNYNINKLTVLFNNGAGVFQNTVLLPVSFPSEIVAGDLDADGNTDLILAEGSGIGVIRGNGNGTFSGETIYPVRTVTAENVALGDFNGDDKIDVAATTGTNSVTVLLNTGGGSLGNEAVWSAGGKLGSIVASDVNQDQKTDLIYAFSSDYYGFTKILFNLTETQTQTNNTLYDYDGDGKADVSVFRSSNGVWYISQSSNNTFFGTTFGQSGDQIAPADFDGDGKTDISVFRNGNWYRINSSNNSFSAASFGQTGDLPIPADFDGDGKADISVYRASTGTWYRLNSSDNSFTGIAFGVAEDKPQIGDFDGDGKADICVFRPSTGSWYRLNSSNGQFFAVNFGISTDLTVPADYDGDGKTDLAVYRQGNWYLLNSSNNSFFGAAFGNATDKPVAADYDGDGKADIGVFRPADGNWYLLRSTAGFTAQNFGTNGDTPTPFAFINFAQ